MKRLKLESPLWQISCIGEVYLSYPILEQVGQNVFIETLQYKRHDKKFFVLE